MILKNVFILLLGFQAFATIPAKIPLPQATPAQTDFTLQTGGAASSFIFLKKKKIKDRQILFLESNLPGRAPFVAAVPKEFYDKTLRESLEWMQLLGRQGTIPGGMCGNNLRFKLGPLNRAICFEHLDPQLKSKFNKWQGDLVALTTVGLQKK